MSKVTKQVHNIVDHRESNKPSRKQTDFSLKQEEITNKTSIGSKLPLRFFEAKNNRQSKQTNSKKQKLNLLQKLSIYALMALSPLGSISCSSNDKKEKPIEKFEIEKAEVQTPKFAEKIKIQEPTFLNNAEKSSTTKTQIPKIKRNKLKSKPNVKVKDKTKGLKETHTVTIKSYSPDDNPKKVKELISKIKSTFEDPKINKLANKFISNLPQKVKLVIEKEKLTKHEIFSDVLNYKFYSDTQGSKKLASITYFLNKDDTQIDQMILLNQENISVLLESLNIDHNGKEISRSYRIVDKNNNTAIEINRTPGYISTIKHNHKRILRQSSNYPTGYNKILEIYEQTKNKEDLLEDFRRYLVPSSNKPISNTRISRWQKQNGKLIHSHETTFNNNLKYDIKTFYIWGEKENTKHAKFIKLGKKHILLGYEYKNENGNHLKIKCLKDIDSKNKSKAINNYLPYKVSLNNVDNDRQELLVQMRFQDNHYVKSSHLDHNDDFRNLESILTKKFLTEAKTEITPINLSSIKSIETNPNSNKDLKIVVKGNKNHISKTVFYKGKVCLKQYLKQQGRNKSNYSVLQEYYDNRGQLSLAIIKKYKKINGQDSLAKQEYRIININRNPTIFKIQEKESLVENPTNTFPFLFTMHQTSSYINGNKVSDHTTHYTDFGTTFEEEKYFTPNDISKEKKEIIQKIEPGIDNFLNDVLKIYKKDIAKYGTLKRTVKSVLKKELRKTLDQHLSIDNIKDEYTAFLAYAKAIEGIKKFFIELCTTHIYQHGIKKSLLRFMVENSIPKIPFTKKYILDPNNIEEIMKKIYADLDTIIIPKAYEVLAQRCFDGNASSSQEAITEFQKNIEDFKKNLEN